MIKLIRFTNILPISLFAIVLIWKYWAHGNVSIYELGIALISVNFIIKLFLTHTLNEKQSNGEIHIFYNPNNKPMYLRWAVITFGALILFIIATGASDTAGWFWLTLLATKGAEHYLKKTEWDVLIENNAIYEKSFWMKSIPISEISKLHINDQAQLEITSPKGMTLFKLDSDISVSVRDQIEKMQSNPMAFYV